MADRRSGRILLEIIACSVEDARNAEAGGAERGKGLTAGQAEVGSSLHVLVW
jgi:hypothetical protein